MTDWYDGGLRFSCTGCGDCCTGEPGNVWVNQDEIERLASYLDIDAALFEHEYVRRKGSRRSLYERFNGDCILFDGDTRRCTVYSVRPTQCRTWPFWKQNVESEAAWAETCEVCPGSGSGDLIPVDAIRRRLADNRSARSKT